MEAEDGADGADDEARGLGLLLLLLHLPLPALPHHALHVQP